MPLSPDASQGRYAILLIRSPPPPAGRPREGGRGWCLVVVHVTGRVPLQTPACCLRKAACSWALPPGLARPRAPRLENGPRKPEGLCFDFFLF